MGRFMDQSSGRILPSAVACVGLFLSLTGTALFFLLCHWLVGFKAWALYDPLGSEEAVSEGVFLLVEPVEHRGKAAIVPVKKFSHGGLGVVFQRQNYDYYSALLRDYKKATTGCVGGGKDDKKGKGSSAVVVVGAIVLVACPVANPVGSYVNAGGLSDLGVERRVEQFGRNDMRIPQPKLVDLFKEPPLTQQDQLGSPRCKNLEKCVFIFLVLK